MASAITVTLREGSRRAVGVLTPARTWVAARFVGVPRIALALSVVGYLASDTPSLLPRPWYFQGLIAGISALIFFVVGVLLSLLWRVLARWSHLEVRIRPEARHVLRIAFAVLLVIALLAYPLVYLAWHSYASSYVGEPSPGPLYVPLSVLTGLLVLAAFIGIWHLISDLIHWLTVRIQRRVVRTAIARLVATVVTIAVVTVVMDQVVVRGLLLAAQTQANRVNAAVPTGVQAPTTPLRSGGPGSHVTWDSVGADGKTFLASGPHQAQIAQVTGKPAQEPIRVFAATDATRSFEETAGQVVDELERTNAFSRKAILVVTSTSTGFVNEWAAESFEYLQHGDTAIATMQYSTLPSALGLLTARDEPPIVGALLFDAVAAEVAKRPEGERPKLYVSGESLGAYGGNGAFSSPDDMLAKVDGALWTGTPSFTPLHQTLTDERAFGSTTVNPTIDGGKHIRFAGNVSQLTHDQFGHVLDTWTSPRVVYLQHDTDPVVWWSPDLILHTPSWLDETVQPGTPMSYMSWWPFVTFWQVTADMAVSNSVPGGFGHRYLETETVPAWAGVLGMDPTADYSAVQAAIHQANPG